MSNHEPTPFGLLHAPDAPDYALQNIPKIAHEFGYPDFSDGVTSIAMFEIRTPEEERVCNTLYTNNLLYLARQEQKLPPEIKPKLSTKIACGTLTVREHALIIFGLKEDDLRTATLPRLKKDEQLLRNSIKYAHDLNLIRIEGAAENRNTKNDVLTLRWREKSAIKDADTSYIDACASLFGIDVDAISDLEDGPLSPSGALAKYIERYGGDITFDRSDQQIARARIKERYHQDLKDKIFYPDPVRALKHLFRCGRQTWRDVGERPHIETHMLNIAHFTGRPVSNTYKMRTEGPTEHASHQAAARLILDHLGATDVALLAQ